jgi:glutathione S-transferase
VARERLVVVGERCDHRRMPSLYHFALSPFSRRTRLALAHKGVSVELKEARQNPSFAEEAKKLWPLRTIPVFVDDGGQAVGDSTAIARYLDAVYPEAPRLFPTDVEACRITMEITTLVDGALNGIIDVGTRYYALHTAEAWGSASGEILARAQGALDALADRAARKSGTLTSSGWCAADIWLFTMVAWLEGLPARASTSQNIAQIMTLKWELPAALSRWASAHRERADVRALG